MKTFYFHKKNLQISTATVWEYFVENVDEEIRKEYASEKTIDHHLEWIFQWFI